MSSKSNVPEAQPGESDAPAGPSFGRLLRTVAWGFFGVRKGSAHRSDLAKVNPLHVLIAGLIGMVVLVAVLVGAAHWMAGTL